MISFRTFNIIQLKPKNQFETTFVAYSSRDWLFFNKVNLNFPNVDFAKFLRPPSSQNTFRRTFINYSSVQKNCSYKFKCMILKPPKDSRDYSQSKEILISILSN